MSKLNQYLESLQQKRNDLIASKMTGLAKEDKCMFCGEPAMWKTEQGEKFCNKCKETKPIIGKLTKINK